MVVTLLVLVAGVLVTTWSAFERSTIPITLDGEVSRVVKRHGKLGGSDDVWQLWIEGEQVIVDRDVAALLEDGQQIRKSAWSSTIETDTGAVEVGVSSDVWRSAVAGAVAFAVGCWALAHGRVRRDRPGEVR